MIRTKATTSSRVLRSQIDRKTHLRVDPFSLGSKVGSSDFNIKSTIHLVGLFVNNAPDVEIWRALFDPVALTSSKQVTLPTTFEKAVFTRPFDPAQLLREESSRHTMKSTGEFSSNSQGASTTMLEDTLNNTLRGRPGGTRRGIPTESRWRNMPTGAGAGGQSLQFKTPFRVVHEVPGHRPQWIWPQILHASEQSVEGLGS